jgi:hypothetical protein
MGKLLQPIPPAVERCEACFTTISDDDIYCANCGYPLKGTALEQKTFIFKQNKVDFDLIAFKKRINKAGSTLFYLSGFFILAGIYNFLSKKDDPDVLALVIPNLILGILFLLLGEYSKKKMLACFISGLCLFIIIEILLFVADPNFDLAYDVFVVVILVYLIRGIKSAIEIEKIKKENNIA